jgi:uncharacterized phage protein gp47/JayE
MAGPYPLPTLAAQITATGVSAPTYADILASLQASYRLIYGADINLDPSTQDGQWLAVLAQGYNDCNSAIVACYNQFSPATAVGAGLSSVVKINGIAREAATNSTADLTIVGTAGTVITNGVVGDANENQWALPASVTIPAGGSIVVTATCQTAGAISAAAGTITNILNPTLGWQSATNAANAVVGQAAETDSALRQRQSQSTSLPALTPMQAIVEAVENVTGVTAVVYDENDTGSTDANGVPAHTISLVVEGGDATAIATAIASKKAPGLPTYGTTTQTVVDSAGQSNTINFFRPTSERIVVAITIKTLAGFVTATEAQIQNALAAYVNGLGISGGSLSINIDDLIAAAKLPAPVGQTYKVVIDELLAAVYPASPANADITLAFGQQPSLAVSDITLTVTS